MNISELKCFHVSGSIKKSIEVMDEFTDPDQNYDIMVLDGWFHNYQKNGDHNYSISLCISQDAPEGKICHDDITMTRLRELHHHHIGERYYWDCEPFGILPAVTKTFLECDKNLFNTGELIPLEYAVHLRAQTSWNRIGYGWEWDWSGGIGDYTEGTFYGETTDFFIKYVIINRIPRRKSVEELREEKVQQLQDEVYRLREELDYLSNSAVLSGKSVRHKTFGAGAIEKVDVNGVLSISFPTCGTKRFVLKNIIRQNLITFLDPEITPVLNHICMVPDKIASIEKEIELWINSTSYGLYDLIYNP